MASFPLSSQSRHFQLPFSAPTHPCRPEDPDAGLLPEMTEQGVQRCATNQKSLKLRRLQRSGCGPHLRDGSRSSCSEWLSRQSASSQWGKTCLFLGKRKESSSSVPSCLEGDTRAGALRQPLPGGYESESHSVRSDSCDFMDCSLPGSSVHGVLQARILQWVVIPFSRDLPHPGIESWSPSLQEESFWAIREALEATTAARGLAWGNPEPLCHSTCWVTSGKLPNMFDPVKGCEY